MYNGRPQEFVDGALVRTTATPHYLVWMHVDRNTGRVPTRAVSAS